MPEHDGNEMFGEFHRCLDPLVTATGLALDDGQVSSLYRHYQLLLRWNSRMNLTGIHSPSEIVRRHFGESLFLAKAIGPSEATLVDIGSGAGFPGVPVAIARPSLRVTLVESVARKAAFLREVVAAVPSVTVLHGRFEQTEINWDWAVLRGLPVVKILPDILTRARRLAVLSSRENASEITGIPTLTRTEVRPLPWDPRTVLVLAEICSSSRRPER